jgi:prepilin-type N-terminal cleavage/methylation domain-containing protein
VPWWLTIEKGEKMKTDKKNSREDSKTLRKRDNYFKTLCRSLSAVGSPKGGALVANRAFTLPELLTVVAIIAILIGILMPALYQVKKMAKDTKQKAQLVSIEMAVNLYKNDFGDYPPSHGYDSGNSPTYADYPYCGAQTFAEAMFGQDLLGVHPDSIFRENGEDGSNNSLYPDPFNPDTNPAHKKNLDSRKGPYLARENIGVFKPVNIFDPAVLPTEMSVSKDKYVICDVFEAVNRSITLPNGTTKNYKIGTPILYYKANPAAQNRNIDAAQPDKSIYNGFDNRYLVLAGKITNTGSGDVPHNFEAADGTPTPFYDFIKDKQISTATFNYPVRPDSFLLISAGNDGLYGTSDDICNFTPNLK